ncbi:hypothetical protein AB0H73_18780 [Streptomyces olivoreticuli]
MSTTFKKTSGVSFEKASDPANKPSLRDQVRNLKGRLHEVARDSDALAGVVAAKCELADALIASNEQLAKECDRYKTALSWHRDAVLRQMHRAVKAEEIDRETANEVLEALGLEQIGRKYRVSVEVTVLEDRWGGDGLHADDVRGLLEMAAEEEDSPLAGAKWGALSLASVGVF